jgi:hypothetical protein
MAASWQRESEKEKARKGESVDVLVRLKLGSASWLADG